MSGLQNFVKGSRNGRAGSPQNGQPSVNPQRQAIAANAKVQMKSSVARPTTAQELPARGESVAQHQPASLQQPHPPQRPSSEGRRRAHYDTDAESLDTTVNHSVIQVENSPQLPQQLLQPDDDERSETGSDEEEASEETSEDGDEGDGEFRFTDIHLQYLKENNMLDASNKEQVEYLSLGPPHLFPTVDGDSYPTTTDGNPTEWDEHQEPLIEEVGSLSPSPQRLPPQGPTATLFNPQPLQRMPAFDVLHANPAMPQNSILWRQGAQIRGQQRTDNAVHTTVQSGQQHNRVHLSTSQPPTYSQVTRGQSSVAHPATHARPDILVSGPQGGLPHRSSRLPTGPGRTCNPALTITQPATTSTQASASRANLVPIVQQQLEPALVEEPPISPLEDYDSEDLFKLGYNQLKDESFDKIPRQAEPLLPEDMCEKPLGERLEFAQCNFDRVAQSKFFSALPTHEWEDAGDWFLDQFSTIIKNTKEARRKKRTAAQGFEREIEMRHEHIAKKQRIVESAMAKMKTQGEGLVPKSPRVSKSPR